MIEVTLLGRAAVTVDGVALSGEAAQRRRIALLALLSVPSLRPLSRDRLMAYLWPENDGESARHSLSVSVSVLRKSIGHESLVTSSDEVALAPGVVRVDVAAFEEALHAGDCERAVALYAGPFMDGFHAGAGVELEQWVDEERTRLQQAYAHALEGAAAARRSAGDLAGAAEAWRRLAALDPYSSHGALGLMRALADAGNRAAAIRHAAVHRQLLEGELDAGPDPDVEALAEALRVEPPTALATVRAPMAAAPSAPSGNGPSQAITTGEVDPAPDAAPLSGARLPRPPATAPGTAAAQSGVVAPTITATPTPPSTAPVQPVRPVARRSVLRQWRVAALALLLLALSGYVGYRWWARAQPRRVAVLPLTNLSASPDYRDLGDGISDAILSSLQGVPGLQPVARTSSFQFRDGKTSVKEIGRRLGVMHVLEGSVQVFRDTLRVNVALVNTRDESRVWNQSFAGPLRDIYAIQDSIAVEVASRLSGRRTTRPERHLASLAALRLYQQGRRAWSQRTPQTLADAISYFDQAIREDSLYARAWASLAEALVVQGSYDYGGLPPDSAYPRAIEAARRAIALDSTLPDAWTALAAAHMDYDWKQRGRAAFADAEQEYLRAIELGPDYSPARQWYGLMLIAQGRNREALQQLQQAAEVEPSSAAMSVNLAHYFYYARDFDRSAEELERALALEPGFPRAHLLLALVDVQRNRAGSAVARAQALRLRASEPAVLGVLGYAYARAGQRDSAQACLQALMAARRTRYVPSELLVLIYAGMGDKAHALDALDEVYRRQSDGMVYLAAEPAMDPLKDEPRFVELVRRVGARQ